MSRDVAAEFEEATNGWQVKLQADEWFFARLRERLADTLAPSEAFQAIDGVAEMILRIADVGLRCETGELLVALARRSNTTELPAVLQENWQSVRIRLHKTSAENLQRWYRVGGGFAS